jgi:protein SCO1/2
MRRSLVAARTRIVALVGAAFALALFAPLHAGAQNRDDQFPGFSGTLMRKRADQGAEASYNDGRPKALENVGVDQRLDNPLPLDLEFTDHTGATVRLGDYFESGKPVLFTLAYYGCPMLCTQVLNGVASSLKGVGLKPYDDFLMVNISFDSTEAYTLAAEKRQNYVDRVDREGTDRAWHFLVGDADAIAAVTDAAGFRYAWDPETEQFAHASVLMVLTPEGHVSRYLFGMEFAPRDVRLALVEASQNKIGSLVDQVLLFCYHYDPATGKYGAAAMNLLRGAAVLLILGMTTLITVLLRRDKRVPTLAAGGPGAQVR